MIQTTITIQNQLGLHTRAAAHLVNVAKGFQSHIKLIFNGKQIDCKSILSLITLGAQKGQLIEMTIEGEDEKLACEAIKQLVNNKFGEAE